MMHYQPEDERHGEVFPSNTPYVEYQGFFEEDTVLKVLHDTKDLRSRGNAPKEEEKGCRVGSQPPWMGSASRNYHDGRPARVTVARVAVRAQV